MKHKKLSQSEIEQERKLNEQEMRLRSIADSEQRRLEKPVSRQHPSPRDMMPTPPQVKKPVPRSSKEAKGTGRSTKSWTNEEFGKVYEPVSATELRKQRQVRQKQPPRVMLP